MTGFERCLPGLTVRFGETVLF